MFELQLHVNCEIGNYSGRQFGFVQTAYVDYSLSVLRLDKDIVVVVIAIVVTL